MQVADRLGNIEESEGEAKTPEEDADVPKKYSKLQKLLLKGHINEEQFICLELLQKGFIPSSKRKHDDREREARQRLHDLGELKQ